MDFRHYSTIDVINYFIQSLSPQLDGTNVMKSLHAEVGINLIARSPSSPIDENEIANLLIQLNLMSSTLTYRGVSSALLKSIDEEINTLKNNILTTQSKFSNEEYQEAINRLTISFNIFINRISLMNTRSEIVSQFNMLKNSVYRFYCEFGRIFINMNKNEQAIMNTIKMAQYWVNQGTGQSYIDVNCINMLYIEIINLAKILKIEIED